MRRHRSAFLVLSLAVLACTSTTITQRQSNLRPGEKLLRPDHIIVHDFSATPEDVPADSSISGDVTAQLIPPSEKELEAGRQLGESVAKHLVEEIDEMGLPAVRAADQPTPDAGDIVLHGYFVTIEEGSAVKRVSIGFGAGGAGLTTMVEAFQMTHGGRLRRLGSGEVTDGGAGKTPGLFIPIAVTLATANPIGLAVGGAVKAAGELSGRDTIEGAGRRTAELIAEELKVKFQEQGWIE
jgi:hypothetical protein